MPQTENVAERQTGLNDASQYVRGIVMITRRRWEGVNKLVAAKPDVGWNLLELECPPSIHNHYAGLLYHGSKGHARVIFHGVTQGTLRISQNGRFVRQWLFQ